MSLPIQPLASSPFPAAMAGNGFSIQDMQQALSLNPSLGSSAAAQALSGGQSGPMSLVNPAAVNPLHGAPAHSDEQLRQVSKQFESIFMRMIFKEMRNSVQKSGLMGNSHAMEFFEEMRDEQLSDSLASAGGLGLGNVLYQKLKESTLPHQRTFR